MITSQNRHQPNWCPWVLWVLWNPVDAIGCRNEHTGVTDHSKVTTTFFILGAMVLHACGLPLPWWSLLILGTLCFSDRGLYTTLLKSGIFKGTFSESHEEHDEKVDVHETKNETITIRQERDPASGIDPA